MVQVLFHGAGKQFRNKWVFRGLHLRFEKGQRYAVLGDNGTGKSTLIKMAAGYLGPTRGKVVWMMNDHEIPVDDIHSHVSIAAPYMELPGEMSLRELIRFHARCKPFPPHLGEDQIVACSGISDSDDKRLQDYSSGMIQRVKLLLAILPQTPLLLLDEPCTNLDPKARAWYIQLLESHGKGKTIVVASNHNIDEYTSGFSTVTL